MGPRETLREVPQNDDVLHQSSYTYSLPRYSSYQPQQSYVAQGDHAHRYLNYPANGRHAHNGKRVVVSTKRFLIRDGQRIPIDDDSHPDEKAMAGTQYRPTRFLVQDGQRIPSDDYKLP